MFPLGACAFTQKNLPWCACQTRIHESFYLLFASVDFMGRQGFECTLGGIRKIKTIFKNKKCLREPVTELGRAAPQRPDQGKGPEKSLAAGLRIIQRREINPNLPSAVSPSISGEPQLFPLSSSGVSCWGEVISQGDRAWRGGSRQATEPLCARQVACVFHTGPGGEGRGDSEDKEQRACPAGPERAGAHSALAKGEES